MILLGASNNKSTTDRSELISLSSHCSWKQPLDCDKHQKNETPKKKKKRSSFEQSWRVIEFDDRWLLGK
jgi:hypothetical protein